MAAITGKYYKLKGSTLVETLVAFTVLLLCVSMAAMIIAGLARSSRKFNYLEAWVVMQNMEAVTGDDTDLSETEIAFDHFTIRRTVEPSPFTPSIFILKLSVIDPDNRIRLISKSLILPSHEILP